MTATYGSSHYGLFLNGAIMFEIPKTMLTFDERGLSLGSRAILAKAAANGKFDFDAYEERIIALLSLAYKSAIPDLVLTGVKGAMNLWNTGHKAASGIRLAHLRLPEILMDASVWDSVQKAEGEFEDGLIPEGAIFKLLKTFNPAEPRDWHGRWTADGSSDSKPHLKPGVELVSDTVTSSNEQSKYPQFKSNLAAQKLVTRVDGNHDAGEECATYVKGALADGGISINPHPTDAKDYGPYLEQYGFSPVSPGGYTPQIGDVAVIQNYTGGNPAGHITMYTNSGWLSDFVQRDMWGGPGYRTNQPSYQVFRSQNIRNTK